MRADRWSRMPLVRMTNLHLEPGEGSLEDLLADVDDGIFFATNKSWSIDDKRLNFQFGTEIAWEIKKGKLGRMLRDATYTGSTPVFWGSLDGVAGPEEWRMRGLDELRQGPAGPARARLARRLARTVPERPGRRALVRERRARARLARARSRVRGRGRGLVHRERSGFARFAASAVHQPTLIDEERHAARGPGRQRRNGPTNRTDEEGAREAARRAERGRRQRAARPGVPRARAAAPLPTSPAGTRRPRRSRPRGSPRAPGRRSAPRAARALRLLHVRRDAARGRVDHRAGGVAGDDGRDGRRARRRHGASGYA